MTLDIKEEEVFALVVRQQVERMMDGNIELLKNIIAADATFIHITGAEQSRDQWLQQIKNGRMHYFNNNEKLMQVMVKGDQAQVISRNELDARIYGFRNTWPLQASTELKKINGKWVIYKSRASMY